MPTNRKRVKRTANNFNLEGWQLRYLETGQLPYDNEVKNKFAVLNFCWSYGAGLTWLKIRDHVPAGTFPYAEESFNDWKRWRQVTEALKGIETEIQKNEG